MRHANSNVPFIEGTNANVAFLPGSNAISEMLVPATINSFREYTMISPELLRYVLARTYSHRSEAFGGKGCLGLVYTMNTCASTPLFSRMISTGFPASRVIVAGVNFHSDIVTVILGPPDPKYQPL